MSSPRRANAKSRKGSLFPQSVWLKLRVLLIRSSLIHHSSGNTNRGQIFGEVKFTNDRYGEPENACAFKGKGSYIKIPNHLLESSSITISVWFKNKETITSTSHHTLFITKDATDSNRFGLILGEVSGAINGEIFGVIGKHVGPLPRSGVLATTAGNIQPGWHHLVVKSSPQGHTFLMEKNINLMS